MPKPKKNESKQDFLSRCTGELIKEEGRGSDQAYAMCNAFWDDAKGTRNSLSLSAPVALVQKDGAGKEEAAKSFLITAYTGQLLDFGWRGKLVFDVKGMQAKEKFPVLREHQRDRVVGIGTRSWRDANHFYMGGDFTEFTLDGREVLDLAQRGFPWQASVGIWPKKVKVLESDKESLVVNGKEIQGPAEVWLESLVGEVSFVSLGADDRTAAIVLSDQSVSVEICGRKNFKTGGIPMFDEFRKALKDFLKGNPAEAKAVLEEQGFIEKPAEQTAATPATATPTPSPPVSATVVDMEKVRAEAKAEATQAEKARVAGITDICALAGVPGKAAGFITAGKSVDDVRKDLLAARAEEGNRETIISATTALGGEVNPLLMDAKRRADAAKPR